MTTAESNRHDLYNGLSELIGPERADTLMAYLPNREYEDLATRSDLAAVENTLSGRIDQVALRINKLDSEIIHRFDAMNQRLDNIVLTLAAGLVAIIVAMIVQGFI